MFTNITAVGKKKMLFHNAEIIMSNISYRGTFHGNQKSLQNTFLNFKGHNSTTKNETGSI